MVFIKNYHSDLYIKFRQLKYEVVQSMVIPNT